MTTDMYTDIDIQIYGKHTQQKGMEHGTTASVHSSKIRNRIRTAYIRTRARIHICMHKMYRCIAMVVVVAYVCLQERQRIY
jgi:hypothetical protein